MYISTYSRGVINTIKKFIKGQLNYEIYSETATANSRWWHNNE
jgi:hypothetical protein